MIYKNIETINKKIDEAKQDNRFKIFSSINDESVQIEQRLTFGMSISIKYDSIHTPKQLRPISPYLKSWQENTTITREIYNLLKFSEKAATQNTKINIKTKTGPDLRKKTKENFEIETGNIFLNEYSTAKKKLPGLLKKIKALQDKQKDIIKQMRAENSAYLAERKNEKAEQTAADQAALTSGEFWKASKEAIKAYFHPLFDKNYLADVSEKWRAALFVECKSESYKNYAGNWRHKLVGTGKGWLCGIDDNGDEWGHDVNNLNQRSDEYGSQELDASVEDAMAELFGMSINQVKNSYRQGDLMLCPVKIRKNEIEICANCGKTKADHHEQIHPDFGKGLYCDEHFSYREWSSKMIPPTQLQFQEKWHVRESHTIWSPGLMRNGQYFSSIQEIEISHTSHEPVYLPAGEYRLYKIKAYDAD